MNGLFLPLFLLKFFFNLNIFFRLVFFYYEKNENMIECRKRRMIKRLCWKSLSLYRSEDEVLNQNIEQWRIKIVIADKRMKTFISLYACVFCALTIHTPSTHGRLSSYLLQPPNIQFYPLSNSFSLSLFLSFSTSLSVCLSSQTLCSLFHKSYINDQSNF